MRAAQPFAHTLYAVHEQQARESLQALLPQCQTERLPLAQAVGRRLAQPLGALVSHPNVNESAMDGLACRWADTVGATLAQPATLHLLGESRAGAPFQGQVGAGEAVRISTGAALPAGADAIVRAEECSLDGGTALVRVPARREDIRLVGSDFEAGEEGLGVGTKLTPARLGLAAALGHAEVTVYRPWRVTLLTGGDELRQPGERLGAGEVYDSNGPALQALLRQAGAEVQVSHVPDQAEQLAQALAQTQPDLLLTTGGVGPGKHDLVRQLLTEQGELAFEGVKLRPGGPMMAGRWQGLPLVGLPGNPVSALVTFLVVVEPVLSGRLAPMLVPMTAATDFPALSDRNVYWRAHQTPQGLARMAQQGSGMLKALAHADALALVSQGEAIQAGERVQALLL